MCSMGQDDDNMALSLAGYARDDMTIGLTYSPNR